MKKLARFVICLAVVLSQIFIPARAESPEAQSPADAVAELMGGIKSLEASALYAPETDGDFISDLIDTALAPVLAKLDYKLGNTKITDNRAAVDISVTAADIGDSMGLIAKQAAGLAIIAKVLGVDIDIMEFILMRVKKALRDESLTAINTDATVYMVMGGDGKWKLDLSDEKNLGFLKALSGGAADLEEPVRELLARADTKQQ